eukprot:Hpha_TRINITY_DN14176_c0_g1::TRINITY_DN14176_c0_g1_i2::g.10921::m.10921
MLRLLSCAVLVAAAAGADPNPIACAADVVSAAGSLTQAGTSIASAVKDCPQADKQQQCSADIGGAVSALGSASASVSKAVQDCGGPGTECAAAVSQVVSALGAATTATSKAAGDCQAGASKAGCTADVLAAAADITMAGSDIAKAVEVCGAKNIVPKFFDFDPSVGDFNPIRASSRGGHHNKCCSKCSGKGVRYFAVDASRLFCYETCVAPGSSTDGLTEVGKGAGCAGQVDAMSRSFDTLVRTGRGAHGRLADYYHARK